MTILQKHLQRAVWRLAVGTATRIIAAIYWAALRDIAKKDFLSYYPYREEAGWSGRSPRLIVGCSLKRARLIRWCLAFPCQGRCNDTHFPPDGQVKCLEGKSSHFALAWASSCCCLVIRPVCPPRSSQARAARRRLLAILRGCRCPSPSSHSSVSLVPAPLPCLCHRSSPSRVAWPCSRAQTCPSAHFLATFRGRRGSRRT